MALVSVGDTRRNVEIISRHGCHLCEVALEELNSIRREIDFELIERFIDADPALESEYGFMVPVILIDGKMHGYGRVERERFVASLTSREIVE